MVVGWVGDDVHEKLLWTQLWTSFSCILDWVAYHFLMGLMEDRNLCKEMYGAKLTAAFSHEPKDLYRHLRNLSSYTAMPQVLVYHSTPIFHPMEKWKHLGVVHNYLHFHESTKGTLGGEGVKRSVYAFIKCIHCVRLRTSVQRHACARCSAYSWSRRKTQN